MALFIIDPKEIDKYTEDIKELAFGCCFMMSARNVIVAIDMSHCEPCNDAHLLSSKINLYNVPLYMI